MPPLQIRNDMARDSILPPGGHLFPNVLWRMNQMHNFLERFLSSLGGSRARN